MRFFPWVRRSGPEGSTITQDDRNRQKYTLDLELRLAGAASNAYVSYIAYRIWEQAGLIHAVEFVNALYPVKKADTPPSAGELYRKAA